MENLWTEISDRFLTWPTLPFSVLLLLVMVYWLIVSLGFLAFDALDFDLDFDADVEIDPGAHPSLLDLGFLPLKWLNLGSVPLMIWGSVFTLVAWIISRWLNAEIAHAEFAFASDSQVILRDAVLAAVATKFLTNPLRGLFDYEEPNKLEAMLGQTVRVTTSQLDDTFGEVEYTTDGAPLRLNAITNGPALAKDDLARLVGYDEEKKVYVVEAVSMDRSTTDA